MGFGFRFEAYTALRKQLGEFDAIVEWNELAVRSFLEKVKENPAVSVAQESAIHKIKVNYTPELNKPGFTARRTQFYLLSVYQQAEIFLDGLLEDLPRGIAWKETKGLARRDKEAQLDWIVRVMQVDLGIKPPERFFDLVATFNYFRLIRNAFMHEGDQTRTLNSAREKLEDRKREIDEKALAVKDYLYRVPNTYSALNFDDFVQFTRVIKEIGEQLNANLKPELDSLLAHHFSHEKHYGLRQYAGNKARFSSACMTLLCKKFNLDAAEIQYAIPKIEALI